MLLHPLRTNHYPVPSNLKNLVTEDTENVVKLWSAVVDDEYYNTIGSFDVFG